jgi:hopene-associated glycosyltransferase HpnB
LLVLLISGAALAAWLAVLVVPWQPSRTRERLEPDGSLPAATSLADVTVLIPARNEADVIADTLRALTRQGTDLRVIVVDDDSSDGTAAIVGREAAALAVRGATAGFPVAVEILSGRPLPDGWGGKLWALQQGLERAATPFVLLLDADIGLAPGMIPALLDQARRRDAALVSIMARLSCASGWEKLLAPAFVLFFKLLYPFALANTPARRTAAAAGGCLFVARDALAAVDAFASIRAALIDDCALAARIKQRGYRTWIGLSDSVVSRRAYPHLVDFWRMVSRTAYTQLRYSLLLLSGAMFAMVVVFCGPWLGPLVEPTRASIIVGALGFAAMAAVYLPVVRFYRLPWPWCLTLPVAGVLFMAMTLTSAINYYRGVRARWKDRAYAS